MKLANPIDQGTVSYCRVFKFNKPYGTQGFCKNFDNLNFKKLLWFFLKEHQEIVEL